MIDKRDFDRYTESFKINGKSKYGDMPIIYKASAFTKLQITPNEDGSLDISGYASTNQLDSYNEIVEPSAFVKAFPKYLDRYNGTMLFGHDFWGIKIGKFHAGEIRADGLWVEGKISPTTAGKDVIILTIDGALKDLSVGFNPIESFMDPATNIMHHKEIELIEISIANIGATPGAQYSGRTILNETIKSILNSLQGGIEPKGVSKMADLNLQYAELEKKYDNLLGETAKTRTALETYESEKGAMQQAFTDLRKMAEMSKEKVGQLESGLITKAEFAQHADKVKGDLAEILKKVESAKAGGNMETRIRYKDWRSFAGPGGMVYLKDDQGRPLPDLHQKAFHYFQAPVDYKSSPDGEFLKRVRDCHDTCLLVYAYMKGKKYHGNIQSLKSYQMLHNMMERLDPEFAKAMYSTGAALGDEWVPTLMSSELIDLVRLSPNLGNYFPRFEMPSNPYDWPIKVSGATAYLASEASVDNPTELHKSSMGTGKITFTAGIHAVAIAVSPELIEDAIIDMASELRIEIARALADGEEKALLNGDTTAIHRDTTLVTAAMTDDIQRAFIGLRYKAIDDSKSWNTQSTSAGVGDAATTFTAPDVRYNRQLLAELGTNPREVLYVTSITPYYYILSMTAFARAYEFGAQSPWYTGELPIVDGTQIYVSGHMPETLDASGLAKGSTYKGILAVNFVRGFKIGERRGITVEFDKNILTQQWRFVATRREDFQKMQPTTRYPVAYGYNIA